MKSLKVKVVCADLSLLPEYKTAGSACMDLIAAADVKLWPGDRTLVPTGIRIEIPIGWEAQIRPRSGLAFNHGITVLNAPGTIDSDFRGEVQVLLVNLSTLNTPFEVKRGERIAQISFHEVTEASWELVEALEDTNRGVGGFGSTGRR